ncbi:MAG: hypothetical protein IPK75_11715 [Acidobacteria bacterium]|jgi:hypothetical protein|nr:hypothetical protein [Acidobacteriota bacterium]
MTHRIVNTVRSLAMYGAVSLGLRQARISVREPDPRRSSAEPEDVNDSWMFDRAGGAVSSEAYMLDQEYGRVSGALAGLRAVLSNLTKMPLAVDEPYVPMAAATPAVSFDPMLFEEVAAPVPVLTNVVAFDEDDLFIESSLTLQKPSASIESLSRVA